MTYALIAEPPLQTRCGRLCDDRVHMRASLNVADAAPQLSLGVAHAGAAAMLAGSGMQN